MLKRVFRTAGIVVAAAFLASGCATTRDTRNLLQQDYHTMSNEELLRYFYELNDRIQVEERSGGTSVGVGIGGGPLSLGVSKELSGGAASPDLRHRRVDVQVEM